MINYSNYYFCGEMKFTIKLTNPKLNINTRSLGHFCVDLLDRLESGFSGEFDQNHLSFDFDINYNFKGSQVQVPCLL